MAFGAVCEGWMNFGYLGVVFQVAVFTAVVAFIPLRASARGKSPIKQAFSVLLGSIAYGHFRADLAGVMKLTIIVGGSASAAWLLSVLVSRWYAVRPLAGDLCPPVKMKPRHVSAASS